MSQQVVRAHRVRVLPSTVFVLLCSALTACGTGELETEEAIDQIDSALVQACATQGALRCNGDTVEKCKLSGGSKKWVLQVQCGAGQMCANKQCVTSTDACGGCGLNETCVACKPLGTNLVENRCVKHCGGPSDVDCGPEGTNRCFAAPSTGCTGSGCYGLCGSCCAPGNPSCIAGPYQGGCGQDSSVFYSSGYSVLTWCPATP